MTGSTFVLTLSASFEAATSEGERAPKGDAPSGSAGFAGQLPIEIWTFGPVAAHVGIELRKFEEVNRNDVLAHKNKFFPAMVNALAPI